MNRRNGTASLERILKPVSQSLNAEAARQLVRLKADAKTQARVDELAAKCNEGELKPAERTEYENYVAAGSVIAILQAEAQAPAGQELVVAAATRRRPQKRIDTTDSSAIRLDREKRINSLERKRLHLCRRFAWKSTIRLD